MRKLKPSADHPPGTIFLRNRCGKRRRKVFVAQLCQVARAAVAENNDLRQEVAMRYKALILVLAGEIPNFNN